VKDLKSLDDWYNVTTEAFKRAGGASVLSLYKGSIFNMLIANYPEHKWDGSHKQRVPTQYWKDKANQLKFFQQLGQKLSILSLSTKLMIT
jgi:hypothetical protein